MNPKEWGAFEWMAAALAAVLLFLVAACVASCRQNDRLNNSMVGRQRAALVLEFGPPTRSARGGEDSEVIEWVRHDPGYFQYIFHSDGRGGGWTQMIWIPEHDVIRRAVVRNGVVEKCEGGF